MTGRAEVTAVRSVTPDVIEVDLAVVEPAAFHFKAGQWISVPFGPKNVRVWTMVSPPSRKGPITLSVDVAPGGIGSQFIRGLAVGASVPFKGPTGGFTYDRADPRRPLFVAEEIGIVPIRSILTELYETGHGRPTALVFWARDPAWLLYDADFRSLARRYPSFSYFPVVREAPAGWRGDHGELAGALDGLVHSVDGRVAYVCGGGETIKQARQVLTSKGMDRKAIKWEKFWT